MSGLADGAGLDVLLIDGRLVGASGGATFETANPATEETLGPAADATAADMDAAVTAARRAFDETGWSTDHGLRVRCIRQLRDALAARAEELRALTTAEVGAPAFLTAGAQFDAPVADLGYVADLVENYDGWRVDLGDAAPMGMASHRWYEREAAGVVGAITPWNFPHQINLAKVGPALAAGCTVVLKAAPDTPWCAAALARVAAEETDLPPGVLNVVTSADHGLGARLASDPRVDLVSFTGSTATGRKVMSSAAQNITRVFLELGGKSAFLVLDDADLAAACAMAGFTAATHAGQGCAITTRLVVPAARYDDAVDATAATMGALAAGDPTDPATICGPLISARQRERVEGYLRGALAEGGSFAVGGGRSPKFDKGFFVDPTLVVGLGNDATIAREEVFGPVLAVQTFRTEAEAVAKANATRYGLSAGVWTEKGSRILWMSQRLQAGVVWANTFNKFDPASPFGGVRESGHGREGGRQGLREYLDTTPVAA